MIDQVDDGRADVPVAELDTNLADIATATRLLATRVAELEAELNRRAATIEQLRMQLGTEMGSNRSAACARCEAELAALQATRLFRWSAGARTLYRRVRLLRHPDDAYRRLRARMGVGR